MNYRHAYHAANHADVLKHAVLARLLVHLAKKDKPFRVIDAHAGLGLYSLNAPEAGKTLEWREGVGRLYDDAGAVLPLPSLAEAMLAPWREVVGQVNGPGPLETYPASPEIARRMMRRMDKLSLNELHPEDFITLSRRYAQDLRVVLTQVDAGTVLKAQLPPPERRGLILIDPPYEKTDEAQRVGRMLAEGLKRFATGIFAVWYPVTGDGLDEKLGQIIRALDLPLLQVEMRVRSAESGGLAGSGLFILNPPWQLDDELKLLLPALTQRLAQGPGAMGFVR